MHNENLHEKISNRKDYIFHKGQSIIYHGEEASVLNVGFVLKLRDEVIFVANKNGFPIYSYDLNNKGGNPYERDLNRPAP